MARLDLHGFVWKEAREELVQEYNAAVARQDPLPFEVIHGYGAAGKGSVLRSAVRTFLGRHGIHFTPGEDYDGNPGHTYVTPNYPLPNVTDRLQCDILEYCANPRTKSEISGKFRRCGQPEIDGAMATLKRLKLLEEIVHNGRRKWRTTD